MISLLFLEQQLLPETLESFISVCCGKTQRFLYICLKVTQQIQPFILSVDTPIIQFWLKQVTWTGCSSWHFLDTGK